MENQPSIFRGLLIPVLIGLVSMIGIGLVFSVAYLNRSEAPAVVERTATPFKYLLLATETDTPLPESETPPPEEIFPTNPSFPTLITGTQEGANLPGGTPGAIRTPTNVGSQNPTVIPTVGEIVPMVAGKYDDADISIEYFGDWVTQSNIGSAYQGTLHVSNTIGNDLSFIFEGQQIQLGYQTVSGLGTLVITIDEEQYVLAQASGSSWVSPQLDPGPHFVIIIHESGDSVNVDYITILDGS